MDVSSHPTLVQVELDDFGVALVKLNRPEKRNALSQALIDSLASVIASLDRDENVRVLVLTGSRPAGPFSAGADLSELLHISTPHAHKIQYLVDLSNAITRLRKPIIAAVSGFALGGGFELALMCDIIYSTPEAKFSLPELSVGTIPGAGGTQRLTRALGKHKAMDMILTSATITGAELEKFGLVSWCFDAENLLQEAMGRAKIIAERSVPVIGLAKEAVLAAEQTTLDPGLKIERTLYYASFSLEDRTEGMQAFVEKRKPVFKNR